MAALATGVQYGLSSRSSNDNTSLIFVKLTDSAFRAIEEYLKNVDRTTQKPTIQFLQNKGHLSIPKQPAASSRPEVFNFSISPNSDEGTFECLQSTGSRALESLGALSHSMHIQAKDDVYEATRNRMAEVEEQQKRICTQVIKPNVNEIGRRVKVTSGSLSNHSTKPPSTSLSGNVTNNLSRGMMRNPLTQQHSRVVSNNHAQKPGNPELMRRPLRERLIHVLALRPYKKPELWDRFQREGLYEKDKKIFARVLSEVTKMKDNTFHLIRSVWNDIQEDWPFYSEQDRQILKRRKPQNLTPPGSSDTGSSGSGQSPTSTHPGSPPAVIQGAIKRPAYVEAADVMIPSKRRISHYQKSQPVESYRPSDNLLDVDMDDAHVRRHYGDSCFGFDERRNKRLEDERRKKEEERSYVVNRNVNDYKKSNNFNSDFNNKRPNIINNNNNYAMNEVKETTDVNYKSDVRKYGNSEKIYDRKFEEKVKRSDSPATVTSSQPQVEAQRSKYGDYSDTRPSYQDSDTIQENTVSASEIPDYLTEYTTISNDIQRRRYKEDFTAHYEEYKMLHAQVEKVTNKFAELDADLRKMKDHNNPEYHRIKKRILQEYEKIKSDKEYQEAKRKFNYLHEKLSHIKKLVMDYDNTCY